ncbi:MAG: ribonuclease HII [Christensenellaceae bacterium]|jgi:ribonuclease HII|nr:ribonuclease HII [Christensenellaceae bacterium]
MARTKEAEARRLLEMTQIERPYWAQGACIAGMDEVGRGPLAGPVVAACIVLPEEPLLEYVNDSKKVSPARRQKLYPALLGAALSYGVGWVAPQVIDTINILQATKLAFAKAYAAMAVKPELVLIDAVQGVNIPARQRAIVHGDALSYLIAAASIVAKVERDAYMTEMDAQYPQYGFAQNKGYGTARHIAALREHGPCPLHRRSFITHFVGARA